MHFLFSIKERRKEKRCQNKDGNSKLKYNHLDMKILIKDTTKSERVALIKSWIPIEDGLDGCDMDLWEIYADYIDGKKELAEINAELSGTFYEDIDE